MHANRNNSKSDKQMSQFITRNMAKSVLISNTFLLMFYVARFKTFRNSYLAPMMLLATAFGIKNGVDGTKPIFDAYLFNKNEIKLK